MASCGPLPTVSYILQVPRCTIRVGYHLEPQIDLKDVFLSLLSLEVLDDIAFTITHIGTSVFHYVPLPPTHQSFG